MSKKPVIFEIVDVECYHGYKASERPLAFTYREQRWDVDEILDRWFESGVVAGYPNLDYFKVRTNEGSVFLLRHNLRYKTWAVRKI
ncbi:MAG: hypothetical protein AB7T22_09650 [Calditrichaceae bacterium]